jgi:hypothetical protein
MAFEPRFEGAGVLDELLGLCGATVDAQAAISALEEGHQGGEDRNEIISSFFEGEPRPPSPDIARRLFENLIGIWDLLEEGRPVASATREKPERPKKHKVEKPAPFEPGEPTEAFVESVWKYLEAAEPRERNRLLDAFENRQDALLTFLDEPGLSDEGYATARSLLFELFAMLELGTQQGTRAVRPNELATAGVAPPPLVAYVDDQLFEAQEDEELPLSPEEAAKVRERVLVALGALWNARRQSHG